MARAVRSARVAGLDLPYLEQGDTSGLPVLLVHAYVDSWRSFERVLPHLPRSLHAFALTQRGHGDADKPSSGYGLEDFADELAGFMDVIGLETAVVVGSSSGGYVVQRFALDYPGRAFGVVLVGSPRSLRDRPQVLDAVAELDDPVDPAFVRDFVAATTSSALPSDFLDSMVFESRKVPAHVWKQALDGLVQAAPPTETGTILAPTLVLWGDRDEFLSYEEQLALAGAIPQSRLVVYENVGHIVHWERPERVAADIAAFAESVASESVVR